MKNILEFAKNAVLMLIMGIILLFLLPLILIVITIFRLAAFYEWLWQRLRHDPKVRITIEDLEDDHWQEAETEAEYITSFDKLTSKIAALADAKMTEIELKGFEVLKQKPEQEWCPLSLTRSLSTKHAEVKLSLAIGATGDKDGEQWDIMPESEDDRCGAVFPYLLAEITKPKLHIPRKFYLNDSCTILMVIGHLKGEAKFGRESGQMWTHLPDKKIWLVQYKTTSDNIGFRNNFSHGTAHAYWFDTKPEYGED